MKNIWQEEDRLLEVHARRRNERIILYIYKKKSTIIRSYRQELIIGKSKIIFLKKYKKNQFLQ